MQADIVLLLLNTRADNVLYLILCRNDIQLVRKHSSFSSQSN